MSLNNRGLVINALSSPLLDKKNEDSLSGSKTGARSDLDRKAETKEMSTVEFASATKPRAMTPADLSRHAPGLIRELNKIIDAELVRRSEQQIPRRTKMKKALGYFATTLGFSAGFYGALRACGKYKEYQDSVFALRKIGNALYGQMQNVCTSVFSFINNTCTVIQNLPCNTNCADSFRNCDVYDPYLLNCTYSIPPSSRIDEKIDKMNNLVSYTTPILNRLANCSSSLFSQYKSTCDESHVMFTKSLPYLGLTLGTVIAITAIGMYGCLKTRGLKGSYNRDEILKSRFSTLPPIPETTENSEIYNEIINLFNTENITVGEMLKQIQNLSLSRTRVLSGSPHSMFGEAKQDQKLTIEVVDDVREAPRSGNGYQLITS